ncbi:hypothetical protein ACHAWF_012942 [Thalassiosira exigua]
MTSSPSRSASRSRSRDRGGEDGGGDRSSRGRRRDDDAADNRGDNRGDDARDGRGGGRDRKRREKDDEGRGDRSKNGDGSVADGRGGGRDEREKRDRSRGHRSRGRKKSSSRRRSSDRRRSKKRRRRRSSSSESSSSSGSSGSSSSSSSDSSSSSSSGRRKRSKRDRRSKKKSKPTSSKAKSAPPPSTKVNERLLTKLSKRNETLEEREERRAKRRAARITARFGYTAEDNPFRDPNLHETFTWKKKEERGGGGGAGGDGAGGAATKGGRRDVQDHTFAEIEKVRQRRVDRELHLEEMDRIKAEESRMKELENYDEWARKEEEFHLQQQRQRSAIRLVEGRERPVDVLAQNMLLFGLSDVEKENRARVKYREKYSALEELEKLESNLEEPHLLLKDLKLAELEELVVDVDAFRRLEKEAAASDGDVDGTGDGGENTVIRYWDALHAVTSDETRYLKTGGENGEHASLVADICKMFQGQSLDDLAKMKSDIEQKLRGGGAGAAARFDEEGVVDTDYWQKVLDQLNVHLAKAELSDIHSKMLVRQLEKLEARREELQKKALEGDTGLANGKTEEPSRDDGPAAAAAPLPRGVEPDFGNLEEELGLGDEVELRDAYAWQDRYRPRKPRYFNRVKTGYDWNAYNKTHYDHDNPPPKIVQGYKFNVFYPDLIDHSVTPRYALERADTDDFCILRFSAGPPYEDVAFKIINRQWNKSRKRGFRCTFERGVLSLYVNFASHWYRR